MKPIFCPNVHSQIMLNDVNTAETILLFFDNERKLKKKKNFFNYETNILYKCTKSNNAQ